MYSLRSVVKWRLGAARKNNFTFRWRFASVIQDLAQYHTASVFPLRFSQDSGSPQKIVLNACGIISCVFCVLCVWRYCVRVLRVAHVLRVASCVVFPIGIGRRRGLHRMAGRAGVCGGDGDYLPIVGVGFSE